MIWGPLVRVLVVTWAPPVMWFPLVQVLVVVWGPLVVEVLVVVWGPCVIRARPVVQVSVPWDSHRGPQRRDRRVALPRAGPAWRRSERRGESSSAPPIKGIQTNS